MSVLLLHRVPDVTISAADFWIAENDPFAVVPVDVLDTDRLRALIEARDPEGHTDLDVTLALMDLVRDDLQHSGTEGSGSGRISDIDMRVAVRALERSSERAGQPFKLPFRDHTTWKSYWIRKGAAGTGGWQARRDLLGDLFDESYASLMAAQDRALDSTLAEAVSPRERLGWHEVDTAIGELRKHFRTAETPQDYKAVGLDCVTITEALGRVVYNHARHTPAGEAEPHEGKTKLRLERYIEERLPGAESAELRKLTRAAIEMAEAVKHGRTPDRTKAGIAADAVILLANMLRRLEELRRP